MVKQSAPSAVPVLITRPEGEAQAFATALTHAFGDRVRPIVAPLMAVEVLHPPLPGGPFAGVIFTSGTAVAATAAMRARLPDLAWCVGAKTAERATEAGFQARSADGDAEALVAAILADPPAGRLLHLRGEDTRGAVAEQLVSAGIETLSLVVYRQVSRPLTPEAMALLQGDGPVIVPLFSPRSATLFGAAAGAPIAPLHLVALSPAVAEAASKGPHLTLGTALHPDANAMLAAVGKALERVAQP